ncbi:hypothetical protein VNO77_23530 [Canavalia gladiata]|uniref:C3H1-type domain-containing protein n=1 Tax=Canavalia gladiata TaxID=3824 RepID=A0AAN9L7Y5_CANGL
MYVRVARRSEPNGGKTCVYWLAGRCNRNPCRFFHEETSSSSFTSHPYARKPRSSQNAPKKPLIRKNGDRREGAMPEFTFMVLGSWLFHVGKASPTQEVGSDKLYSGSTDGTVRTWDCHTGQCTDVMKNGVEVTSLISEGPWVFVDLRNAVKAWNIQTTFQFTLDGPKGRDGVIAAWRGSSESKSPFELVASLTGHTKAVVCLAVGGKMLFSGSNDKSIKVWDLDTLNCKMTLDGHNEVVTSLICWDYYLLSSSSDCTIKIWVATDEGTLEVTYTHTEENGVVALFGMTDAKAKPILFCSCKDNSVCMYELPSFVERGRLFAKQVVKSIELGPGGHFFTGDGTGLLMVWKWLEEPKVPSS